MQSERRIETPLPDEAHIWHATLYVAEARIQLLRQMLSPDEHERAARYRLARDRARYIIARGTLRTILGRYLDVAPPDLRFVYGPHGKPALAPAHGDDTLAFNLSHADDTALYAVTRGQRVGIDLERVDPDVAASTVAEHTFSPREVAALRALPPHEQRDAFFRCWTRKEAYVKALGAGLSLDLKSFDVSLAPGTSPTLLSTRPDPREAVRWSFYNVNAGRGYIAALAVEGWGVRLITRNW